MKLDKKLILNKIKDSYKFTTDTQFANFLGIKPTTLSSWYSRNTFDIDLIYSKCVNINCEFLLSGLGSVFNNSNKDQDTNSNTDIDIINEPSTKIFKLKTDLIQEKQLVPLYDIQATASTVSLFRDSSNEKPVDHISIPNLPKCDGAVYVSGDSMYPLLKSGDIIMYKKLEPSINNIFWGEMYMVSLVNDNGDDFVMVKWLHKSDKGDEFVKLVSENRHHQPKDFHLNNIKGLALIKASVRINSMY
ncbi:MAG: S24 family peptidase [Bacteroidota bacterium]